ncbi:hypothetical protein C435_11410 [Haloarcula marismortui ATCC 33799]|uniref:Carboxypeptidase regulatory-like domain-containing protein n=2 Tax=Haloarcula marismortui TaxID=2238 RepID=M0KBT4_9EURY|nr:hypothetical protein C435_11410 [Haloarcula californiae ATCC 33799]
MICPGCQQRGLKQAPKFIERCGDSEKQRIFYATACTNPDCEYHGTEADPNRVPPEAIKRQYSEGDDSKIPSTGSFFRLTAAIAALAGIGFLLLSSGGLLSDGSGTAQANPYSDLNESDSGITTVDTIDPWTIYEVDGEYYVAGVRDGQTVYLDANGEVVPGLVTFGSRDEAETAIREWQTRNEQGLTNETISQTPAELVDGSPWAVYEYNGSAFIAAERNGEVVYINSSLGIQDSPFLYENVSEARDTLLEFESTPAGLVEGTDWEPIEYGDNTFVGATPDTGPYEGETVFLDPDGSVSEDPYFYDNPSDANDAIDNFPGWNETTETINLGGGGGGTSTDNTDYTNPSGGNYSPPTGSIDDDLNSTAPNGNLDENIDDSEQTSGVSSSTAIRGTVTDQSGSPVEGATIHLYSAHYTTTTDSTGTYEFSDVPTGEHAIHVEPPEDSGLTANRNTTLNVESEGITSVEDTPSAAYFIQNGVVTENRINFNLQTENPVQLTGQGTNVSAPVMIANSRNADDYSVTLTGKHTEGIGTKTVSAADGTEVVTVSGGGEPATQAVAVDSTVTSERRSVTLTDGDVFRPDGNVEGTNAEVTVIGQGGKEQKTISGNNLKTITNSGYKDGTDGVLTVTGDEYQTQESMSGTGSGSVTNDGNIETVATLTLKGKEETEKRSLNQNDLSNSGTTRSFSFDGTRVRDMSVAINSGPASQTKSLDFSNGEWDEYGDYLRGAGDRSRLTMTAPADGTYYIPPNIEADGSYHIEGSVNHDASLAEPKEDGTLELQVIRDGSKTTVDSGTIYCGRESYHYDGSHCSGDGANTPDTTQAPDIGGETVRLEKGDKIRLDKVTYYGSFWIEGDYPIYRLNTLGETTITVDSGGTTESQTVDIGANESQTVTFDSLPAGDATLSISGANAPQTWAYDLEATEVSVTENIAVDTAGGSQPEAQYNGALSKGETVTKQVPLNPGTQQLQMSHAGPAPSWDITYTETTATTDLSYTLGNEDIQVVGDNEVLRDEETKQIDIGSVPTGQSTVGVSTDATNPEWKLEYTEHIATVAPSATIGAATIDDPGVLEPGETIQVNAGDLSESSYQVSTTSDSGPRPTVEIEYDAQAIAERATVTVNGEAYRYPEDFNSSGRLTRTTDDTNITALKSGENSISVSSDSVDGIDTDVAATLRYPETALQTRQPTVHIIRPDGTVTSQSVPETALSSGELTGSHTMELGQQAFDSGEHLVVVETPDGSQVAVEVTGTATTAQSEIFEPTSTLPTNSTVP